MAKAKTKFIATVHDEAFDTQNSEPASFSSAKEAWGHLASLRRAYEEENTYASHAGLPNRDMIYTEYHLILTQLADGNEKFTDHLGTERDPNSAGEVIDEAGGLKYTVEVAQ